MSVRRAPGGRWMGLGEVRVAEGASVTDAAVGLATEIRKGHKKLYPQMSKAFLSAGESVEFGVVPGGWVQYIDAGDESVTVVDLDGAAGDAVAAEFKTAFAAADSPARLSDTKAGTPQAPKQIGKANPKGYLEM